MLCRAQTRKSVLTPPTIHASETPSVLPHLWGMGTVQTPSPQRIVALHWVPFCSCHTVCWSELLRLFWFFLCAQSSELGVNPDCHSIEQSQFLHQCCDYNYVRIVFPQNMCDMCFPISILGTLFPTCFFKQGWHVCVNGFGDSWARHSHFHWCFLCMNFSDVLWYWGGNQLQIGGTNILCKNLS